MAEDFSLQRPTRPAEIVFTAGHTTPNEASKREQRVGDTHGLLPTGQTGSLTTVVMIDIMVSWHAMARPLARWIVFIVAATCFASPSRAETTLFYEDFEGPFPGAWSVGSDSWLAHAQWGVVNLSFFGAASRDQNRSKALYCAGMGHTGSFRSPSYVENMSTYLRRPIDLTRFDTATLTFRVAIPSLGGIFDELEVAIDGVTVYWTRRIDANWVWLTVDLSPYVGGIHTLEFRFTSNNWLTGEGVYLDDISVGGIALPDLTSSVHQVSPTRLHAGESFIASGSITNAGNSDAGAFRLGFYLSPNTNPQKWTRVKWVAYGNGFTNHARARFIDEVQIPPETAPGEYLLRVAIDDLQQVEEWREDNNNFDLPFTVLPPPQPDLVILSFQPGNRTPHEGEVVTLTLKMTNQSSLGGSAAAGHFKVGIYLTNSGSLPAGMTTTQVDLAGLAANASQEISVPLTIPDHAPAGIYYVHARLDDGDEVSEGNEGNNWSNPLRLLVQSGGRWTPLSHDSPVAIQRMHLLSDGTVLCQQASSESLQFGPTTNWYTLTPDRQGGYLNGTWSPAAPMKYSRTWYASALLKDGRLLLAGGEYGTGTTHAEVFDPRRNAWYDIPIPAGLITTNNIPDTKTGQNTAGFSDAVSEVLPDGRVLIAPVYSRGYTVIFDPRFNTFTAGPETFARRDQSEASWVKLADDSILTVDQAAATSQRYVPSLGKWVDDARLPISLYSELGREIGPAFLLPNGDAMFLGGSGHTSIYSPTGNTNMGTWRQGPEIPLGLAAPDAPAAMLPNGNILCAFGPLPTTNDVFVPPTYFFEYDYRTGGFTRVNGPSGMELDSSAFACQMLALPDGNILFCHNSTKVYAYTRHGEPVPESRPSVARISPNPDGSYHLEGTGLNGISAGAFYGDDAQMNSNFPIVRMTHVTSGVTYYAFTHHWSSTGVRTGSRPVSTEFSLPDDLPAGEYQTVAVANGVPSDPVQLTIPRRDDLRVVLRAAADGQSYVGCWSTDPGVILKVPHLHFEHADQPCAPNPVWIPVSGKVVLDGKGAAWLTNPVPNGLNQQFYRVRTY